MSLKLDDFVSDVPLVGEQHAKHLKRIGIEIVRDLLEHYPSRYDDFSSTKKIAQLSSGETVTVSGTIAEIKSVFTKSGKTLIEARIKDETGGINLIWFNRPFLLKTLRKEVSIKISGRVGDFSGRVAFISPEFELKNLSTDQTFIHTGRLVPVYPETDGISSKWLRSRIKFLLDYFRPDRFGTIDSLEEAIRREYLLLSRYDALFKIHFPKDNNDITKAKERLGFDEIFLASLKALRRRREIKRKETLLSLNPEKAGNLAGRFIARLPFKLTSSQRQSLDEIISDLCRREPMNRILQGDVGSGKTIVALIASLITAQSGGRVLLMAPTEFLAQQHYQTFEVFLSGYKIPLGIKTGSTKRFDSKSRIIIGTHSLLYHSQLQIRPSLVIIDEQHKFGVIQRSEILKNLEAEIRLPHLLTMTATPIPRSLSLTILGDLDISFIKEKPPGRKPIKTWFVPKEKRISAYRWITEQIRRLGSQAVVVCPLIEISDSESLRSVKSANEEFRRLSSIFREFNLGLLHGRLKNKEKNEIINQFRDGKIDILVSTAVVEVGIDLPNLTIMVIEGADRFGLASLHQFRGRVGRSSQQSYCLLFSETEDQSTVARLKSLEKTDSGLILSMEDLKRRGPGEIFGTAQSGSGNFKIADLSDWQLIAKAVRASRKAAESNVIDSRFPLSDT